MAGLAPLERSEFRQRADYTFKPNIKTGRHGWLRLTPAYSVKVVDELLPQDAEGLHVHDPFCGTGTTALCASYRGAKATTTDINPFLTWLAASKLAYYEDQTLATLEDYTKSLTVLVKSGNTKPATAPPLFNIERWWSANTLKGLCAILGGIKHVSDESSQEQSLLLISFCRTLIRSSNAAFNHQSMSFKECSGGFGLSELCAMFAEDVAFTIKGAQENPFGMGSVSLHDARLPLAKRSVDLVITSPPYANRMSYIRELRPYMYWLGFLESGRDAGELDWTAIGGTWGIATSRLADWSAEKPSFECSDLEIALQRVEDSENKNGMLMSRYVRKYCYDMWHHFSAISECLNSGARVHYIVGNSTFYGVTVPVEELYAKMLSEVGFVNVQCKPIRKRNSKKELYEFDVSATWR